MGFWATIFIVLMLLWLFGGGYAVYSGPSPSPVVFFGGTFLPWACVAILGALVLGGLPGR